MVGRTLWRKAEWQLQPPLETVAVKGNFVMACAACCTDLSPTIVAVNQSVMLDLKMMYWTLSSGLSFFSHMEASTSFCVLYTVPSPSMDM